MNFKIFTIIQKNFLIIFNSKLSSIMLILGPILLILLSYPLLQNTSIKNVNAGIYSSVDEDFTKNFIDKLHQNSFIVERKYSLESCKQDVIDSDKDVCIELQREAGGNNLNKVFNNNLGYRIILYVDYSNQRVVWQIIASIQSIVTKESDNIKNDIIVNIHDNLNEVIQFSDSNSKYVDNSIIIIDNINTDLNDLDSDLGSIKDDAHKAKYSIIELNNDLAVLLPYAASINNSFMYDKLKKINDSASQAANYSNKVEEKVNLINSKSNIPNSINGLNNLKTALLAVRSSYDTKQRELEDLNKIDLNKLTEPLPLSYQSVIDGGNYATHTNLNFLDYFFPTFLIIYLLFVSIIFSSVLTIRERISGAYLRNITSEVSNIKFIVGNFITFFLFVLFQIFLVIYISHFFLNINILSNLFPLLIMVSFSITIFVLIGMIIGYYFNSQESVTFSSIFISILLLIFSSLITPKEFLPQFFSNLVSFIPTTFFETKFISLIVFGSSLKIGIYDILFLVGSIFVLSVLLFFAYKKSKYFEMK
ncbi:MAG: ABC transporter permease [Nanoarchaeota archaeon]|nr:ABC transporter permease [Nanoarchaeota archaeon]